jgi:hypothetical protein
MKGGNNKMSEIDLTLNIKEFESEKKKAQKDANERYHGEEPNRLYSWEDCKLINTEESVEDNQIKISGTIVNSSGKELGFVNVRAALDLDKLIEIFQSYIKKLNKVKTVMESVKD